MTKEIIDKDNPHKDIGKQKFRVRMAYTAYVDYDVVAASKDEAVSAVIEKGGIETLAEFCPDLESKLLDLNDRFLDLIIPFRGGAYYDSNFYGSFSIKKVLPALCPDDKNLNYKSLEISNGGLASSSYK